MSQDLLQRSWNEFNFIDVNNSYGKVISLHKIKNNLKITQIDNKNSSAYKESETKNIEDEVN